jgi:hypothetical protein
MLIPNPAVFQILYQFVHGRKYISNVPVWSMWSVAAAIEQHCPGLEGTEDFVDNFQLIPVIAGKLI